MPMIPAKQDFGFNMYVEDQRNRARKRRKQEFAEQ